MHYKLEVVMPPCNITDVEQHIRTILAPFSENNTSDDASSVRFWDRWQIGGRYAGDKRIAGYDEEKLAEFDKWCKDQKLTVSGVIWGKQELSPASQQSIVDDKWRSLFGDPVCPLFLHANQNEHPLAGDILRLEECRNVKAFRVIFAAPSWSSKDTWDGPLEATTMLAKSLWNGCNFQDTAWDGSLDSAVLLHLENAARGNEQYKAVVSPNPNWLVVTVDYHS